MSNDMIMNIVTIIVMIGIIAILLYTNRKAQAKKIILALVLEAEQKFGNGTGNLKYAYVIGIIYPKLPTIIRFFVTENQLDMWIEDCVNAMKKMLADKANKLPDAQSVKAEVPNDNTTKPIDSSAEDEKSQGGDPNAKL